MRPVFHSASVQYTRDGPGAAHTARAVAPAVTAVATPAARQRRASSSRPMKIAGVSLTAAASPMPTPARRPRPVDSSQASLSTRASSSRFTCPKLKVSRTGSNRASAQAARAKPNQP